MQPIEYDYSIQDITDGMRAIHLYLKWNIPSTLAYVLCHFCSENRKKIVSFFFSLSRKIISLTRRFQISRLTWKLKLSVYFIAFFPKVF